MKTTFLSLATFLTVSFLSIQAQTVDLVASVDALPPLTNNQEFTYTLNAIVNEPFNGIQVRLDYNPAAIELISLTPQYAYSNIIINQTGTPGLVRFAAGVTSTNITENMTVFTILFKVVDATETISIAHSHTGIDQTKITNGDGIDVLGTANDIILEPLSINDNSLDSIVLYPNPVQDVLYLKVKEETSIKAISIYTLEGKEVKLPQLSFENGLVQIPVTNLSKSLYFLSVTDQNNKRATFKFLVK